MLQQTARTPILMPENSQSRASEAYRSLRFNIEFSSFDRELKSIAVTSIGSGEGKTTTALNLAAAYAQTGKKVLLVDADMRKPSIQHAVGGDSNKGLSTLLAMHDPLEDIIRTTSIENLSVILAGLLPPNPAELLASRHMVELLTELEQKYDMIILDTPPALTYMDSKIISARCGGVLLVMEYGKVKRSAAKKLKADLQLAKINLIGLVWNKVK